MEKNSIVRLALDTYRGTVAKEYADQNPSDVLRQALIEANGGSSKFDYKALRRNKVEIFEILEAILPVLVDEGLKGDEFFMNLVDERNVAAGDAIDFVADDNTMFVVSEIADGVAVPRRQRIGEKRTISIATTPHAVRIYDDLSRFLSGRIDWNEMINRVAKSFKDQYLNDIYTAFSGITTATTGLNNTYVSAGSYSEATLLTLVEHVEAATGMNASILGTKTALRKCTTATIADQAKDDYYGIGYYGKLAGVPMIGVKNRHKIGTDTFVFPDNKIYVVASNDRPVKAVRSGDAIVFEKDGSTNADMTMEYFYREDYGIGVLASAKMGIYTLS